jgi:hypothetical protein
MADENKKLAPADLAPFEDDILRGLLAAAEDKKEIVLPIAIIRKGKEFFRFNIRPLNESEYNEARERATTYSRKNKVGMKLPEETDTTRYRSLLIYKATANEDRAKIWDNKEVQKTLNVINGLDLIDVVLLAGEKDLIIAKIDEISGYRNDEEISEEQRLEDLSKNL